MVRPWILLRWTEVVRESKERLATRSVPIGSTPNGLLVSVLAYCRFPATNCGSGTKSQLASRLLLPHPDRRARATRSP
jgi:hypothetical protein